MTKTKQITIKPANPKIPVRRGTFELPAKGAKVDADLFWQRRLRNGEVVECDAPGKEPKKESKKEGK